jgi:dinuclear metal center YbgI/SA1388 family protein
MRCEEIINRIEEEYPLGCAEEWDNPGLLVGRRKREIRKVLVALDATEDVIRQAIDSDADLIITHHPLLFQSIKKVNDDDFIGKRIITLIENGISCYAMHTNFDVLGMGQMNVDQLDLDNVSVLEVTCENAGVEDGIGRVGDLPKPMTLEETAAYVRKCLKLQDVRCYGLEQLEYKAKLGLPAPEPITRIAVCGGSGKSFIPNAIEQDAQVFVTGDVDYHSAIDALAQGLYIIDAGHYGTEYGFIEYMVKKLRLLFPELEVEGAIICRPFTVI